MQAVRSSPSARTILVHIVVDEVDRAAQDGGVVELLALVRADVFRDKGGWPSWPRGVEDFLAAFHLFVVGRVRGVKRFNSS